MHSAVVHKTPSLRSRTARQVPAVCKGPAPDRYAHTAVVNKPHIAILIHLQIHKTLLPLQTITTLPSNSTSPYGQCSKNSILSRFSNGVQSPDVCELHKKMPGSHILKLPGIYSFLVLHKHLYASTIHLLREKEYINRSFTFIPTAASKALA